MGGITAIVHTAMIIMGAVLLVVAAGAGVYFYYTISGQEEGE